MPTGIYIRTKIHRENMGKGQLGRHHTKKTKQKLREKNLNKKVSTLTKERISQNHADVSGSKNPRWRGGKTGDGRGYIYILAPENPGSNPLNGYIYEHRLVAEKCLCRYLLKTEVIHHINGIKSDNRPENLYLFSTNKEHSTYESTRIKIVLVSNLLKDNII